MSIIIDTENAFGQVKHQFFSIVNWKHKNTSIA